MGSEVQEDRYQLPGGRGLLPLERRCRLSDTGGGVGYSSLRRPLSATDLPKSISTTCRPCSRWSRSNRPPSCRSRMLQLGLAALKPRPRCIPSPRSEAEPWLRTPRSLLHGFIAMRRQMFHDERGDIARSVAYRENAGVWLGANLDVGHVSTGSQEAVARCIGVRDRPADAPEPVRFVRAILGPMNNLDQHVAEWKLHQPAITLTVYLIKRQRQPKTGAIQNCRPFGIPGGHDQ